MHMSLLIQTANRVVTALDKDNQPVLVHCSDGWDRTTQIVSLAELFLDPFYRTFEVIYLHYCCMKVLHLRVHVRSKKP